MFGTEMLLQTATKGAVTFQEEKTWDYGSCFQVLARGKIPLKAWVIIFIYMGSACMN